MEREREKGGRASFLAGKKLKGGKARENETLFSKGKKTIKKPNGSLSSSTACFDSSLIRSPASTKGARDRFLYRTGVEKPPQSSAKPGDKS